MPQETNLNVTPYFDDFLSENGAKENNYYKVLFKPGYPVQARELTTLQSILQNQIEQFGNHFFKEGSVVIPGQLIYSDQFTCVEVESEFLGIPINSYGDVLVGKEIVGSTSGVKAKVIKTLDTSFSPRGYYTIYVSYTSSGFNNQDTFLNSETLTLTEGLTKGAIVIQPEQGFAISASSSATSTGSAVSISEGVYFLRGTFVNVYDQVVILDPYSSDPNYKVGLEVREEIITADDDPYLSDNAQGFSNYAAPGADRLKITAILTKKELTDNQTENFVQLMEIRDGTPVVNNKKTNYNILGDELARRTYDESGDYYVIPFEVSAKEALNDLKGNDGVFERGRLTYDNNVPAEDTGVYLISPGKAYVRGYEIESTASTLIDFKKPRTTELKENQSVNYYTGPAFRLNNVKGSPQLGLSTSYYVTFRDERVGTAYTLPPGKEIGIARVYDFALESGSYNTASPILNEWDIALYDIQPYTELYLNNPSTHSVPTHIKGKSSGAIGYLRESVTSSGILTAYNVSGSFVSGEQLIFNGIEATGITTGVVEYTISDVKSIYGSGSAGIVTFLGDVAQVQSLNIGEVNITARDDSGPISISTITSSTFNFPTKVKVGDLVSYTDPGISTITYSRVTSVTRNTLGITSTVSVTGISNGQLPSIDINSPNLSVISSTLLPFSDGTLYTELPHKFVSSVDTSRTNLVIRKQFDASISGGNMAPILSDINETFLPFDEERYILIRNDGTYENLSEDKIVISNGGKQIEITGLGSDDPNAKLVATLTKINIKSKTKLKKSINSIIIDKSVLPQSGIGQSTLNDGLVYGSYAYGTRVQDPEICLLVPDVTTLYGVFESADTSNPKLTRMRLGSLNGPNGNVDDLIVGEEFFTLNNKFVGVYAGKIDNNTIEILKLNDKTPTTTETISFENSGVVGIIEEITSGDNEITSNYTFDSGQEDTIYDYSKLIRKSDSKSPTRKIRIVFESAYYSTSDLGDITTVSSYDQFNYEDIPFADGEVNCSDIIDIRPRVSTFTVTPGGSRSPFEFLGRTFIASQNSALNLLASDESFLTTYSHYLSRVDKIYLTKDGEFQVISGDPAEDPEPPLSVKDALEIATITLPPYLPIASKVQIDLAEHKRYRMEDIANLEDRIAKLEYYTSLSLLESKTENLFVPDNKGLNRFKSGFFVDNFSTTLSQNKTTIVKNSIDASNTQLRPAPYTTSIDLLLGSESIIGIGTTSNPLSDSRFISDIVGNNIRKTGQLITLDYDEEIYLQQPYGTRTVNVTPFLVTTYEGTIELIPSSDIWIDTVRMEPKTIEVDNFTTAQDQLQASGFDPQTGLGPTKWGSWKTTWTGIKKRNVKITSKVIRRVKKVVRSSGWVRRGRYLVNKRRLKVVDTRRVTTQRQTLQVGKSTRQGTRLKLTETTTNTSYGDRVVNSEVSTFMRSRNLEFTGKRFKPLTQIYSFFDGKDVNEYVFPKLLEITMTSGVFEVGETVIGVFTEGLQFADALNLVPRIVFRACQSNHKYGPLDSPTDVYTTDPYDRVNTIPEDYSETSTILNVDTFSLSEQVRGDFYGWVKSGMKLRGLSSGAEATVDDVKLVADSVGTIIGSFFIPNPNIESNPKFQTGNRTFRLTSSETNSLVSGTVSTSGEEAYFAQGTLNNVQETIVSTRNPRFETETVSQTKEAKKIIARKNIKTVIRRKTVRFVNQTRRIRIPRIRRDPLAQSFLVDESSGIFVTKVDVFFATKDTSIPVIAQLRTMVNGLPTEEVYPFSEVIVDPQNIETSDDSTVPTTITFNSPVFLAGGKEHALVLLSDSNEYTVWVSRLGEIDRTTQSGPESKQVVVTKQPTLGSLFKSQNGSTWDPSQYEDLKYNLYYARFNVVQSGSVNFFNPSLAKGNSQIANILKDSLEFNSKKLRVSLGGTFIDTDLVIGNTITIDGDGSTFTGNYIGNAGSADGNLSIINSGIGYTPSNGSFYTFENVSLVTVTGKGKNAKADISIENNVAIAATIVDGGTGYILGDVLTASQTGEADSLGRVGRNLRFTVTGIGSTNQLIIDNVQGDFTVGTASTVQFINSVGVKTDVNLGVGGTYVSVISVENESPFNDGLHIKVNHKNHGMHSDLNIVSIEGVKSDLLPTKLSVDYNQNLSTNIEVEDASIFGTFENVGVGTTNKGYIQIEDEIISYEEVVGNTLTGITRSIDNTKAFSYSAGTPVYKYENTSVSLRRINKSHLLQESEVSESIGLDHYYIKLNMSDDALTGTTDVITNRSNSSSYPKLHINETKSTGGSDVYATQNIPFEIVHPLIQTLNVPGTEISAQMRSVSGSSINGNEVSFLDKGFQSIALDDDTALDSPRIVCSQINETNKLTTLPGNKSLEISLSLSSNDQNVSPVVDLDRVSVILTSNRVNNVVSNFATDFRVSTVQDDPSAYVYVTNPISLELPATSLKVLITAYCDNNSELRALYSIGNSPKDVSIYNPFPGYNNLNVDGAVIDPSKNDGLPNKKVIKTNEQTSDSDDLQFSEYEFTIDNLAPFRYYSIKLVPTSTNQANPPILRDLRVISLA